MTLLFLDYANRKTTIPVHLLCVFQGGPLPSLFSRDLNRFAPMSPAPLNWLTLRGQKHKEVPEEMFPSYTVHLIRMICCAAEGVRHGWSLWPRNSSRRVSVAQSAFLTVFLLLQGCLLWVTPFPAHTTPSSLMDTLPRAYTTPPHELVNFRPHGLCALPLYSVLGTWQVCPHPFEQHFFTPEHSLSASQLSTQAAANPLAFSGAGQSPCFTDRMYLRNSQLVKHS